MQIISKRALKDKFLITYKISFSFKGFIVILLGPIGTASSNQDQTRLCILANYRVGICIKSVHFVRSRAEELHVLINRLFS